MGKPNFEIVGALPEASWADDLAEFEKRLKSDLWGGEGLQRMVVSGIDEGLQHWLSAAEYAQYRADHETANVTTAAKAFVAHDGLRTAVVPPLPHRLDFLLLACHEMIESALEVRHKEEGHEVDGGTNMGIAHVLWTEYVVERARRFLATSLEWGYSKLENGFVVEQMKELEEELPTLISWAVAHNEPPQRIFQLWAEMARVYAMSLGRADGGSPEDKEQIQGFRRQPTVIEALPGWEAFDRSLRAAHDRPGAAADELDQVVRSEGWIPLHEALAQTWNLRYEAALSA